MNLLNLIHVDSLMGMTDKLLYRIIFGCISRTELTTSSYSGVRFSDVMLNIPSTLNLGIRYR